MIAGMVGHVRFAEDESHPAWLPSMLEKISHRGNHALVHRPTPWLGLGMRQSDEDSLRLFESNHSCVLLDGEIHAGLETTGDSSPPQTSKIWHQFQTRRHQLFHDTSGDYALVIWDHAQSELTLGRDAFGNRPIYFFKRGNDFAFASEIKALLSLPWIPKHLNRERVADFFLGSLEGIDKRCTFFEDIYRIPAGSYVRVSRNSLSTHRHWNPSTDIQEPIQTRDAIEAFAEQFKDAVGARYPRPSQTGLLLSGGLDSCSIAVAASKLTGGSLNTYSLVSGEHNPDCEESHFVEIIQSGRPWKMRTIVPSQVTQLIPDLTQLVSRIENPFTATLLAGPIPLFSLAAADGLKEMITGVDGDVVASLTGNYQRFLAREFGIASGLREMYEEAGYYGSWSELPGAVIGLLLRQVANRLVPKRNPFRSFLRQAQTQRSRAQQLASSPLRASFAQEVQLIDRLRQQFENEHPHPPNTIRAACAHTLTAPYLTAAIERYEEAASMHSLSIAHPFLDQRFVRFCLELPWEMKIRNGIPKWILREAMGQELPRAISKQYKVENIGGWFSNELFGCYLKANPNPTDSILERLEDFIEIDALKNEWSSNARTPDEGVSHQVSSSIVMGEWLKHHF